MKLSLGPLTQRDISKLIRLTSKMAAVQGTTILEVLSGVNLSKDTCNGIHVCQMTQIYHDVLNFKTNRTIKVLKV